VNQITPRKPIYAPKAGRYISEGQASTMRRLTVDIVDLVCSGKRREVGNEEQIEE
jgi:hypothetical protein